MTEQYFKSDAKQMVDMLFDTKIFIPTLTRDELNGIEELIQYILQSKFDSHIRVEKLFSKIKDKNNQQ
jgi:hypothetical protein